MSKRIVWITGDYFIDVDRALVPYLREQYGLDIRWIVLKGKNRDIQIPKSLECIVYELHFRTRDPRIMFNFRSIIKREHIYSADLIYSDYLDVPFYYPMLFHYCKKSPIIHAAHNIIPYDGWPHKRLMTWYVNYVFRKNEYFQIFSKHLEGYFKSRYPTKKILSCPMTLKSYGKICTNNYFVDKNKCNLLFFGNIKDNKRLDLLINSIKSLPIELQQKTHLTIAGKCDNATHYLRLIDSCTAISCFFGRIKDEEIPELFTKHQYLVLPYENVAQSGPHMIAYYYNLPVIASDINGFTEHIKDNETGFLFHVNDKTSLVSVLSKAITLPGIEYEKMKEKLCDYVKRTYSLDVVAKKYIDFFNLIIR